MGALYKRAIGFEVIDEDQIIEDSGKGRAPKRNITKTLRYIAPDRASCIYLLTKNFGREFSERKAGDFSNDRCGIHIHLDGEKHTPRSIRNFVNIIASKNDLFYKALEIKPERIRYCKKMDANLVEQMNKVNPTTFK